MAGTWTVVEGMHCASCVARLERTLAPVPGVTGVSANLATRTVSVAGDADARAVEAACTAAGFVLRSTAAHGTPAADGDRRRDALVAIALAAPAVVLAMTHVAGSGPVQVLLAGLAAVGPGARILITGLRDLVRGRPAMDSLVALGVLAALGLGGWQAAAGEAHTAAEAAAVVIAAVCLGRWLEDRARTALAGAVTDLDRLVPATARLPDGRVVPVTELSPGDLIVVPPGEAVPVDGPVVTGMSTLAAPWLDGEPVPRDVGPGSPARAGAVNGTGALTIRTERAGAATAAARLTAEIQGAATAKPAVARLVDRLARWFTPVVLVMAAATAVIWLAMGGGWAMALTAAAAVLVVACPCALGLAAPLAVVAGVGRLARAGVLVRRGAAIEALAAADTVVLDKTGTLTAGRPVVVAVTGGGEALALAAAVARSDGHPLSRAMRAAAAGIAVPEAGPAIAEPGRGVWALVGGTVVRVGSPAWMADLGHGDPPADDGRTWVGVARDGALVGWIACADPLHPRAMAAVNDLRRLGLRLVLASGDRPGPVRAVGEALGITEIHAGCSPDDKRALVAAGGGRTVMAGDGLNDGPALAAAGAAVAVGGGPAAAGSAADLLIPDGDPARLPAAVAIARRVVGTIRWNLVAAAGYNLLALPVAAGALYPWTGRLLDPGLAGILMMASSLSVVGCTWWRLGRGR